MPQRSAALGAAAWQQQRSRGALAELGGEERGRAELAEDEVHGLGCVEQQKIGVGWFVGAGEAQDESIVGPHRFDIGTAGGADAPGYRHRPGSVNPAAEGREHADAPVAEFVAAALDDDVAIIWHSDGC